MSNEKLTVPNLEEINHDRKPVYTSKQWINRIKQFSKRAHQVDITPLLKGEEITQTGWTAKEKHVQEEFIWGLGQKQCIK